MENLLNIHGYIAIAHKEGVSGRHSKKPGYKLIVRGRNAIKLAKLLLPHLKHPDRAERAKLAIKHGPKHLTQKQLQEWRKQRQKEKQQTQKDVEQAKKTYQQKHKNPKHQNHHLHLLFFNSNIEGLYFQFSHNNLRSRDIWKMNYMEIGKKY